MDLSVWSAYYIELSPEEAMAEFAKYGYHACELSTEHAEALLERGDAKETGNKFKDYCDGIGISVTQGHLYLGVRLCDKTKSAAEILKRWLDLFEAIGIKNAVLHCDSIYEDTTLSDEDVHERNLVVLKELTDYLKGKDVTICLENLIKSHYSVESLLWYIERLGSDNLGICLDTGHLNIARGNQAEFIRKAGKHLKALHIADNEGERDQHMMPFGKGYVDFVSIVAALKEIGYQGLFNHEIPGESHNIPLEIKGYKLEYIRKIYDYLMK